MQTRASHGLVVVMFNNTCTKVHSAVHTVRKYLMSSFHKNKQGHKKSYIIEERGCHVGSDAQYAMLAQTLVHSAEKMILH